MTYANRFIAATLAPALALLISSGPGMGHEFWIEAKEYQVASGASIVADIRNGQNFNGVSLAWFDSRIAHAEIWQNGASQPLTGRMGDVPGITVTPSGDGLATLTYQSTASYVTYSEWEKFTDFALEKGFADVVDTHITRGLPQTGIKEVYTRYCKALITVGETPGTGGGMDTVTGLDLEITALTPLNDATADTFTVQIHYNGTPRAHAQLNIFDRPTTGETTLTHIIADDNGRATLPIAPGHRYLLDTVVIRPAPTDDPKGAMWESLWASLTFDIPD